MYMRMSSKGTSLILIDDEGFVYGIAENAVHNLLSGHFKYAHFKKYPYCVSADHIKVSELYDPDGKLAKLGGVYPVMDKHAMKQQKQVLDMEDKW